MHDAKKNERRHSVGIQVRRLSAGRALAKTQREKIVLPNLASWRLFSQNGFHPLSDLIQVRAVIPDHAGMPYFKLYSKAAGNIAFVSARPPYG